MWIPKVISEKSSEPFTAPAEYSDKGRVSLGNTSGEMFLPYGLECIPPKGKRAAVFQAGRSLIVSGFESSGHLQLEPGEIGLFSSGGASLILKNDGRVLINGHEL